MVGSYQREFAGDIASQELKIVGNLGLWVYELGDSSKINARGGLVRGSNHRTRLQITLWRPFLYGFGPCDRFEGLGSVKEAECLLTFGVSSEACRGSRVYRLRKLCCSVDQRQ